MMHAVEQEDNHLLFNVLARNAMGGARSKADRASHYRITSVDNQDGVDADFQAYAVQPGTDLGICACAPPGMPR